MENLATVGKMQNFFNLLHQRDPFGEVFSETLKVPASSHICEIYNV